MPISPDLAPDVIASHTTKWISAAGEIRNTIQGAFVRLLDAASRREPGFGFTADQVAADYDGRGKVAVITGASSGLGLESARVLASRGCEVVMACRDEERGLAAAKLIKEQHPDAKLVLMPLDTSSLQSVKQFADTYKRTNKPLHILMLNAGIVAVPHFTSSVDGHELQFATNHLGHFLLAQLLKDTMLASAHRDKIQGRVVVVSSDAHRAFRYPQGIRFGAINSAAGYDPYKAYGQSKLANILFARKYAERLRGWPVAVAACHPGVIKTNWTRHMGLPGWAEAGMFALSRPFLKDIPRGTATQVYCAVAPGITSGEYYCDCNTAPSHEDAHNKAMARQLWQVSERMVAGETDC